MAGQALAQPSFYIQGCRKHSKLGEGYMHLGASPQAKRGNYATCKGTPSRTTRERGQVPPVPSGSYVYDHIPSQITTNNSK